MNRYHTLRRKYLRPRVGFWTYHVMLAVVLFYLIHLRCEYLGYDYVLSYLGF